MRHSLLYLFGCRFCVSPHWPASLLDCFADGLWTAKRETRDLYTGAGAGVTQRQEAVLPGYRQIRFDRSAQFGLSRRLSDRPCGDRKSRHPARSWSQRVGIDALAIFRGAGSLEAILIDLQGGDLRFQG
jgi:hypothetical protein